MLKNHLPEANGICETAAFSFSTFRNRSEEGEQFHTL